MSREVPVRMYAIPIDSCRDEDAAKEAWKTIVRVQGFSPVGEPEIVSQPEYSLMSIIGRIVKYPMVTVDPSAQSIVVPE